MAKDAAQTIVQCRTSFFSAEYSAREGDLFYENDPIVKKYPDYFGAPKVRGLPVVASVEQATAAPGEKRGA